MKVTVTIDPTGANSAEQAPPLGAHDAAVVTSSGPIAGATNAGPPSSELVAAVEAALGDTPVARPAANGVAIDAGAAPN